MFFKDVTVMLYLLMPFLRSAKSSGSQRPNNGSANSILCFFAIFSNILRRLHAKCVTFRSKEKYCSAVLKNIIPGKTYVYDDIFLTKVFCEIFERDSVNVDKTTIEKFCMDESRCLYSLGSFRLFLPISSKCISIFISLCKKYNGKQLKRTDLDRGSFSADKMQLCHDV